MRHLKSGRKLNMKPAHRKAMFRNMVSSLFQHRRIETTDAKAKELRSVAEKLITFAKRGDLHARRQVLRSIPDQKVVHELFATIAPAMADRNGGYTRIIKSRRRPGDNAALSLIELVGLEPKVEEIEEKLDSKRKKREDRESAMQQQMAAAQVELAKEEK